MARQTKLSIKKCTIKGVPFFQVTVPLPGGGRQRKTFKDHGVAKQFAQLKAIELRNRGTAGISMGDQLRGDALAAIEILAPFDASLVDSARFFALHHQRLAASETVQNAVSAFLAHKEPESRHKYFKDLRYRLGRFAISFGSRKMADITAGEVEDWTNSIPNLETGGSLSPRSKNTYLLRLSVLWEFGLDRGWCVENIVSRLKKAKVRNDSEVGILNVGQASALLDFASRRVLPYFAVGLFAGLRTVELEKLEWSSVHWDSGEIEVKSWTSKTGSKRFVPMRDTLRAFLEPYRNETGRIFPGRKAIEGDRGRAGLLAYWPENALRHSFASYSLAHFKDSARLSMDLGHTDQKIVFRNYHKLVRASDAAKFWALKPKCDT